MSNIPEHNMRRYLKYKAICDQLDTAARSLGSRYAEDANTVYELADKYRKLAEELRANPSQDKL